MSKHKSKKENSKAAAKKVPVDKIAQDVAAEKVIPNSIEKKGFEGAELEAMKQMRDLPVSESTRIQDERKNTTSGTVVNPGTTEAYIVILDSATPAADAAIRGDNNSDKQTGTETAEGIEKAPDGHDWTSQNSITGATAPAPFAPWDDVIQKDEKAKDELIENLERAAKPATDEGQIEGELDPVEPQQSGFDAIAKTEKKEDGEADSAPSKSESEGKSDDENHSDNVTDFGLGGENSPSDHGATPDADLSEGYTESKKDGI